MKITTSDNYFHGYDCGIRDCERHYCNEHRVLWRDCDTAVAGHEGSGRPVWDLQDCPECVRDYRRKQAAKLMKEWEQKQKEAYRVQGR